VKRPFELVSQHLDCGLGTVICKLCYREGCASNEGSGGRGSFVFRRFGMVFYLLLEHNYTVVVLIALLALFNKIRNGVKRLKVKAAVLHFDDLQDQSVTCMC
jgi:hypothetical protein